MPPFLPDDLRLGPVALAVRDLDRSLAFYTGPLGLTLREQAPATARLGTASRTLIELVERRRGEREPGMAGLFHVALLLPSRAELGGWLLHFAATGARLSGSADHVVSEALYLDDPDGHGLEIYADRPRSAWYRDGRLQMATLPLDLESLVAAARAVGTPSRAMPEGAVVGHVHLESHDVPASRRFYTETLGLDVMAAWPQAVFLAKGGYHHHLAVNGWGHRRLPLVDAPGRIAMLRWTVELPDAAHLAALAAALPTAEREDEAVVVRDPAGIPIRFVPTAG
jgi:catechol 2,3-dioxygenase